MANKNLNSDLDGDTLWTSDISFNIPAGKQILSSSFSIQVSRSDDALYLSGVYGLEPGAQSDFYFYVIKLDLDGNFIFQHAIDGNTNFEQTEIKEAHDGGYFLLHNSLNSNNTSKISSSGQREWTRQGFNRVPTFMGESKDGVYAFFNWDDNINGNPGGSYKIENLKQSDYVNGEYIAAQVDAATNKVFAYNLLPSNAVEGFLSGGTDVIGSVMTNSGGVVLFVKVFDVLSTTSPEKLFAMRLNASLELVWSTDISSIWFDNPRNHNTKHTKCVGLHTEDASFLLALQLGTTVVFRKMTDDGMLLSSCQPDLTLDNVTNWPTNTTAGTQIDFNFDLKNTGDSMAINNYDVKMYLSQDDVFSGDDILLGELAEMNTPVGAVLDLSASIVIPASTANGAYYLLLIVDAENTIIESNEHNNMTTLPIMVGTVSTNQVGDEYVQFAYPNPAVDFLKLSIVSSSGGMNVFNIYDGRGQLLLSEKRFLPQGVSEVEFDVSELPVGAYFVKNGGARMYQSFVIMR